MDRLETMTILLKPAVSPANRHSRIPLATVIRRIAGLEEHKRPTSIDRSISK